MSFIREQIEPRAVLRSAALVQAVVRMGGINVGKQMRTSRPTSIDRCLLKTFAGKNRSRQRASNRRVERVGSS